MAFEGIICYAIGKSIGAWVEKNPYIFIVIATILFGFLALIAEICLMQGHTVCFRIFASLGALTPLLS